MAKISGTEYRVIRRLANDELRICPCAIGYKPPRAPGYTFSEPYASRLTAKRAIEARDETLRKQLYPEGLTL